MSTSAFRIISSSTKILGFQVMPFLGGTLRRTGKRVISRLIWAAPVYNIFAVIYK